MAVLLTSELVTNAIVHGGSSARVRMVGTRHRLRVEVGDDNPCLPSPRERSDEATGGRGLAIVDALAWHWGASPDNRGKVVWFELRAS